MRLVLFSLYPDFITERSSDLLQKHSSAADIAESLSEDEVPDAFLVMLLMQFGTMIIDRAIYLRKNMFGKCVFQVVLVFGIHFWMFFILPGVTERYNIARPGVKLVEENQTWMVLLVSAILRLLINHSVDTIWQLLILID